MSRLNQFFKRSLSAHSWLGLCVGALMYLICLSGTLAVYFEELERWEQPAASEYFDYDIDIVDQAFNDLLDSGKTEITPHMYVTLPTQGNPRVGLITEKEGWFIDKKGELSSPTAHPWTDILTDLHVTLHLPKTLGVVLVSILGVMLLALVVSGFASHRTLLKDAFKLRLFGNKQLEQTDIHNRLSVWGSPFYVMIAVTGAFFGLAMIVVTLYATLYQNNDVQGVTQLVFGKEPELNQRIGRIELAKAIKQMPTLAPDSTPILAIVHDTGTPGQFIEVFNQYPGRLIYSDNFVFDANGNFLHRKGFSDGDAGKQIVYSMYRLHFGHFGGWWTKVIYFLLGLALTVVSVSGINIWLSKRKKRDAINHGWVGFVWGTPIALIMPAIARFAIEVTHSVLFWLCLLACCIYSIIIKDEVRSRQYLLFIWLISSAGLVLTYFWKHGSYSLSPLYMSINLFIVFMPALLCTVYWRRRQNISMSTQRKRADSQHFIDHNKSSLVNKATATDKPQNG